MSTPIPIPVKVSLQASSASVKEGAVAKLTVIGDPNAQIPFFIVGLTPEDLASGAVNGRVMLDDLGIGTISLGIAADGETEGTETLIVNAANSFAIMSVEDTSKAATTYYINASDGLVEEGKVATFSVSAENGVPGTKLPYTITGSGVTSKDVINGKLSGSVALGADGSAIITVPIKADATTEGDEELTVTLTGRGAAESITIEDTSTETVVAASYTLWAPESAIEEGGEAEFLIETSPSEAGKQLKWTITGVSAADVLSKKLTGTITIEADGTASILIPTSTDALTEGNETLTLTVNNQKASVALLDNKTLRVASIVLESDSLGTWGVYKLGDGAAVIAEAGLVQGDELADYVPLKASPSKNYSLPKTVASLISYEDGSFGLLSKSGTNYSEQKFSGVGIAKGAASKLTAGQLLEKESQTGVDLNGDGIAGDAVAAVLDGDGDPTQQEFGLYRSLSGAVMVARSGLAVGDELFDALVLQASKGKLLSLKPTQTVLGLAQTESNDWEVLLGSGKSLSTQAFDAQTGIASGKVVTVKLSELKSKETQYGLDLNGDGEIGGDTGTVPGGGTGSGKTVTAGSGVSKVVLQTAGVKTVASRDVGVTTTTPSYHQALVLGAAGGPGTTLNIDYGQANGLKLPLIVGAVSTDRQSNAGKEDDKVLSDNNLPASGLYAGIGNNHQGIVNVDDAVIYLTGGLLSTYILKEYFDAEAGDKAFEYRLSAIGAGFFDDSKGVMNITDSSIYLHSDIDPENLNSSNSDLTTNILIFGTGGGSGTGTILNSTLESKGNQNNVNVGELGSSGRLTLKSSQLLLNSVSADFNVGPEAGRGTVIIDASRVQLIAKRSTEPLLRKINPLTLNEYAASWSGAYLAIGYDQNDGSAKTNTLSNGSVDITNGSLFLVKGPHAGIEVGGSGTRSTGVLNINASVVEVVGSGAIKIPNTSANTKENYLSAGINDGGDLNVGYFTFMNIGGTDWRDFGGTGTVNLSNGAELKIYGFDITSGDTILQANNANLSIGEWGTKASLVIEGGSKVSVAGDVKLGLNQDMAQTDFSTDAGLANVSNYSMANIAHGRLDVFSYNSSVANQGIKSPLANYAMYTVLGNQGTLTANQLGFYEKSQIIGSGSIILNDLFSKATVSLHPDVDTSANYVINGTGSDGFMMVDEAELFIGDTFNFDTLGRRSGFGTLTMKDQTATNYKGSLTIEDSTLVFDISKSQSDKLVIDGFDYCSINRNSFVVTGNGVQSGQSFVLIDFRLKPDGLVGDLEQLLNLKLIGVKGELTYDEAAMDVIFTVF